MIHAKLFIYIIVYVIEHTLSSVYNNAIKHF